MTNKRLGKNWDEKPTRDWEPTCGQSDSTSVGSRAFYLLILLQTGMFLSTLGGNIGNSQNIRPTMFYTSFKLKY